MLLRNENVGDAEKSFEDFLTDGRREAELEIPEVMKASSYQINNNGSFEDLYKQIDKIINGLR
jgi:dephospho-CoA kinase